MTTEVLIRDVPRELKAWIDEQSSDRRTTNKEFLLEVLTRAWQRDIQSQMPLFDSVPVPKVRAEVAGLPFRFIDLFAGIGGMRLGLERVGGRCVFGCEWDRHAQKTYRAWFGELPAGDIREIPIADIPDHDLLAAGFPCQPFSIAGVSKKKSLGRAHGFKDVTQGTLFFHIAEIIDAKRPPVILLENVKNLKSHDKGKTWMVIRQTLEDLEYDVYDQIIDASAWVPQHRERIFVVGFDRRAAFRDHRPEFRFPTPPEGARPRFRDILDPEVSARYTLTDHLWNYLQRYAEKHRAKGNGFGFGMTDLDGISRTLSARYYKDGSEILIPQGKRKNPRRLSPREAARLMGFPDDLPIVVSDTQAYRQFGNAVVPAVVEAVGKQIVDAMAGRLLHKRNGCLLKVPAAGRRVRKRA